jgi:mevalonate kinase
MSESPVFHSKILLFGEYSIILHAMGLAVPYPLFEGRLLIKHITDSSRRIQQSNNELRAFSQYIKFRLQRNELEVEFDAKSLEFDIAQGLFFQSNIPQGFGVGSSGALTASLYERYVYNKTILPSPRRHKDIPLPSSEDVLQLKKVFGQMESHFHGSSSGIDPLICYLNTPILIKSKTQMELPEVPKFSGKNGAVFLLNTGRPRKTEPLVNLFLEKCKQAEFADLCKNELMLYNDACINNFLTNDISSLFDNLKQLSAFQLKHLDSMIPTLYRDIWRKGLETDRYYLKLCGAGGGGFILGFTRDMDYLLRDLDGYQLRVVYKL